ncbi:MAG: hypothetical protein ACUVSQ_09440, partial [Pseudanabaenaceae cyanobacterium]
MRAKGPKGERYYRLALMGCGEPVLGVRGDDEAATLWLMNGAARQLLGYGARSWTHLSLLRLGLSPAAVRQLLQGGSFSGSLVTAQGEKVAVAMRARPLAAGYFVVTLWPGGSLPVSPLAVLAEAATALAQAESLAAIAAVVLAKSGELFPTARVVFRWRGGSGESTFCQAVGLAEGLAQTLETFCWLWQEPTPWFWGDGTATPLPVGLGEAVGAIAVLPWGGRAAGGGEIELY